MNKLHAEIDLLYQQLNIPTGITQLNTLNLGRLNCESAFSESNLIAHSERLSKEIRWAESKEDRSALKSQKSML